MRLVVDAKGNQWLKATAQAEKVIAKASTLTMRRAGKEAQEKGRQRITAAGFSQAFARTLVALNKPKSGYVLNPHVWLHSTVNYADVFEKGATIVGGTTARGGAFSGRSASPYLWLPTDNVPANPGRAGQVILGGIVKRDHMTPSQYVRKVGPLFTIGRPGKPPLLAAKVPGPPPKRTAKRTRRTRVGLTQRILQETPTHTVIMFVAVRQITIAPKFDVEAAAEQVEDEMQDVFDQIIRPDEDVTKDLS